MNKDACIEVSVAGASGYTGGELLRYLLAHPRVRIGTLLADKSAGQPLAGIFPGLAGFCPQVLQQANWEKLAAENDLVFLCLPHGQSQEPAQILLSNGCKVIDLGADFRLADPEVYGATYGSTHRHPELLGRAVYGIPEKNRASIEQAELVANPGCYPTAASLALLPLGDLAPLDTPFIIDAKSGVSGAGRSLQVGSLYAEVNENFRAYSVGAHRHQSEIEQTLGRSVIFTPHLVPMTRGILATVYVKIAGLDLQELYRDFYAGEPFVRVLDEGLPATKNVWGTNFCQLAVCPSGHADYAIIIAAIDNLGKGAAGTAVHNMNVMFGFPQETGLDSPAMYP